MKRILGATVGLLAASATAMAADLPVKAPMVAPVMAPAFSWSGCYIGGNVGGKWAQSDGSVTVAPAGIGAGGLVAFGRTESSSLIAGGQLGCNIQTGNWVFGLEGDADWQRLRFSRTLGTAAVLPFPFVAGDFFDFRSDWQASARGRLGYAWDRWMIYATGGAAFINAKVGTNFIATTAGGVAFPATLTTDEKTLVGWTIGGGLEYAVTNNWIVGIEGRYSNYGTTTFNGGAVATVFTPSTVAPGAGTFTFAPSTQTLKLETFEVMGRLSYKFDFGGPVVARY
jgi:outer membrane immunogenic protein